MQVRFHIFQIFSKSKTDQYPKQTLGCRGGESNSNLAVEIVKHQNKSALFIGIIHKNMTKDKEGAYYCKYQYVIPCKCNLMFNADFAVWTFFGCQGQRKSMQWVKNCKWLQGMIIFEQKIQIYRNWPHCAVLWLLIQKRKSRAFLCKICSASACNENACAFIFCLLTIFV